jgi:hypothetical protein
VEAREEEEEKRKKKNDNREPSSDGEQGPILSIFYAIDYLPILKPLLAS